MASFVNPKEPGSYFCHTCFDFSLFYSSLIVLYPVILAGYIHTLLAVVTLILLSFNK